VFEYLGARRPIFCLSAGAASRVIVRTEAGVVANPKLPKQAQDALLHLYECWREDRTFVMGPESKSERYEAKSIAKDLVSFFEDVLGSSSASPQA
ncbi:MAG: hypothetical protein KDB07_10035, partial [Planctomycetes bacterium]|nr:hypothetical protein [Planctomycetota bacterium]